MRRIRSWMFLASFGRRICLGTPITKTSGRSSSDERVHFFIRLSVGAERVGLGHCIWAAGSIFLIPWKQTDEVYRPPFFEVLLGVYICIEKGVRNRAQQINFLSHDYMPEAHKC